MPGLAGYKGKIKMKSHKTIIGEILITCIAFDYSEEDNGEKTLRKIKNMANEQLVKHRK